MDSSCHCIVTIYLWLVYVFSMLLRRSKSSCVTTRRIKKILYLWLGATCSQGEGHSTGVLALEPECDLRFHDQWFSPCGQSNNHDHYFEHHHFPSHHLTGGRHGQNCLLVRLRRVVPCRQISHPGHPVIRVKTGQVHYFPSKVKHFLPTSPLPVDQDSPLLDPSSGFWHSNGQIVTIVSELEL